MPIIKNKNIEEDLFEMKSIKILHNVVKKRNLSQISMCLIFLNMKLE